jgi:hypothetical protein
MTQGRVRPAADVLALTVHGPAGALDLVVPANAAVTDVAREYADQAGLGTIPLLCSRTGDVLLASSTLAELGVRTGNVVVAATGLHRPSPTTSDRGRPPETAPDPGPLAVLWCSLAAGVGGLAAWCTVRASGTRHDVALAVLVVAAGVGLVPGRRSVVPRVLAAPCFLGAAGFAWAWDPAPERLPMVLGVAAAAVAVGAALVRAVAGRAEAQLGVLVVAGSLVFVVTGALTLLGWPPRAAWAILLAGALVAARFVPALAIDVPDQYLVDVERLAVTAWSARDPAPRRRVRSIVPVAAVNAVADRGARVVTTAAGSVLVVTAATAPLLLWSADLPVDRVGARLEVALVGLGLLLSARSYRHPGARALLRLAGLACGGALAAYAGTRLDRGQLLAVALVAVATGLLVVVAAVATGRGWRSVRWSRRAEVAEALCGSSALAVVLVASGFFRHLWEMTS